MNIVALVANWIKINCYGKKIFDLFMTLTFDPIDLKI